MAFTAVAARGSAAELVQLAGKEPIHHTPGVRDTHDRLFDYAGGISASTASSVSPTPAFRPASWLD